MEENQALERDQRLSRLVDVLKEATELSASDVHLAPASPVMYRVDGELVPSETAFFKPFEIDEMLKVMLTEEQLAELKEMGELDFAYSVPGFSRLRLNVFRQRGTYAMALRILSFDVPDPVKIGLPATVMDFANKKRGLVLVTGATGSGKSTTLAALIGQIAKTYSKTIITLEDPVEYLHKHGKSMVLQREIGYDSQSYANALRAALRQDPDVILVGEMRDLETISTAITAAETGHLVFSTLHTNSAAATIDRIVDVFPPYQQQQIRVQLASVIEGIVAQQLLPVQGSNGRVAAFEIMLANQAVRNLIREGKAFQIPSTMQTCKKEGMITMDDAIYDLYMRNVISSETAINFSQDPVHMAQRVRMY
ncbi:MAG: type IV pilus twitching motility protein PilT [Lachnospiraceae bacterium]|nr:type IV pilus twitching motility protein PilT [Lachnospiraceae bacterium]